MQRGDLTLRMRAALGESDIASKEPDGGITASPSGLEPGKETSGEVGKGDKIKSMSSFWKGFLGAILNGALQGGAAASQGGSAPTGVGITAGIGALAGILQYLTQHPVSAPPAPVTTAAIAAVNKTTVIPPA